MRVLSNHGNNSKVSVRESICSSIYPFLFDCILFGVHFHGDNNSNTQYIMHNIIFVENKNMDEASSTNDQYLT